MIGGMVKASTFIPMVRYSMDTGPPAIRTGLDNCSIPTATKCLDPGTMASDKDCSLFAMPTAKNSPLLLLPDKLMAIGNLWMPIRNKLRYFDYIIL